MKTVTFTIEPFTESLNRFKETFKAVQAGRHVEPQEVVGFTSLEAEILDDRSGEHLSHFECGSKLDTPPSRLAKLCWRTTASSVRKPRPL